MENEITIGQFLFGGTHWVNDDPYNQIVMQGFDCLNKESFESLDSDESDYDYFKSTVESLCDQYGWDTIENCVVYLEKDWPNHVQVFSVLGQDEMLKLFEINKEKIANS